MEEVLHETRTMETRGASAQDRPRGYRAHGGGFRRVGCLEFGSTQNARTRERSWVSGVPVVLIADLLPPALDLPQPAREPMNKSP